MCESRKRKDKEEGQREGNEREEGAGDSDMRFDVFAMIIKTIKDIEKEILDVW